MARTERVDPSEAPDEPFIGLEHVEAHTMRLLGYGRTRDVRSSANQFREGDVLYARLRPYLNKVVRAPYPGLCSAEFVVLEPTDAVSPEFLARRLNAADVVAYAMSFNTGVHRPRVRWEQLREFTFGLPPQSEQDRIVAAIERHMQGLGVGREALRSLILAARALRQTALERAVAGNWPRRPLKELLTHLRNGIFVSRPGPSPPGVAIFRISAVRQMALDVEDVRYAPPDIEDHEGFFVQPDDLLFTRYSGNAENVGACARIPVLPRPTLHPDKLIRAVVDRSTAEPGFVEIACSAGETLREIRSRRKTTAGQVGIAGGQLKEVLIPVPPLERQREIVAEVQRLMSGLSEVERELLLTEALAGRFNSSLLQQAFIGRLVPQDPDEEPASNLLRRIRRGRKVADPQLDGVST